MRITARTAVLFFCLVLLSTGSAEAVTDAEWSSAVDAAEAIDPAITAPPTVDTDVSAVGGGDILAGVSSGQFAFSGFRRSGEVQGKMTLVSGSGSVLSADVVCIGVAVLPDGTRLARLIGSLKDPTVSMQSLLFNVSDSGQPGGQGDAFTGSFSPAQPADIPCAPTPGSDPIANGNISIRFN